MPHLTEQRKEELPWEKSFDEKFCKLRSDNYMELVNHHAPDIKSFIRSLLETELTQALTCNKPLPDGSICRCKLDCHLHDWRQRDQIDQVLTDKVEQIRGEIEEIEVSCVRDDLLGRSNEYLKGWNNCSQAWREVRDDVLALPALQLPTKDN